VRGHAREGAAGTGRAGTPSNRSEHDVAIRLDFVLNASPDRVWQVVGDPGRTDWVPGVESCEFDGTVRRFVMQGAGRLSERILLCDPERHRLEYAVIESRAPLTSHRATIQVDVHPEGTLLRWETDVEPVAVEPFIRQSMEAAIAQLQRVLDAELR
jgi:uncharacterized protein YndB with AHSA1/START domain